MITHSHLGRQSVRFRLPHRKSSPRAIAGPLALACLLACGGAHAAIAIVAAEKVYGDIARAVGGPEVSVTSVLASPDQDPHAFEASASIAARIADARVVIYNGAGYDPWIVKLLRGARDADRVTLDVARLSRHEAGDNPHLWYDVDAVDALARAVATELSRMDPAHGDAYAARAAAVDASIASVRARIASLRARFARTPVTATEPVFGYMADALGLDMRNARFQLAVMNGTEPSARDVAAFEQDLRTHAVKALIVNRQTRNALTERMRGLAAQVGVPIVEITETQPADVDYARWMVSQLDRLARALGGP